MTKTIFVPVFMPTETGVSDVKLGSATLVDSKLEINFNDKLPSVAIQRMINRGEIIGVSFVMLEKAPMTTEEKDAADLKLLQSDEDIQLDIFDK